MGTGYGHEPPYPTPRDGDFVPYREFDALARRFDRLESKQVGEALVRLEERQQQQGIQLAELRISCTQIDAKVGGLQEAETKRVALKLGTKGLIAFIVGLVGLAGTIVGIVVALLGGGG